MGDLNPVNLKEVRRSDSKIEVLIQTDTQVVEVLILSQQLGKSVSTYHHLGGRNGDRNFPRGD